MHKNDLICSHGTYEMNAQEIQTKVELYYGLAKDEPMVCHTLMAMKDICDCEDGHMTIKQHRRWDYFKQEYMCYAKKQDKERLNDLKRYQWVINKLPTVLKDKDKVRKLKLYYNKHMFTMLFETYYMVDVNPAPRIDKIKSHLSHIDNQIYYSVYNATHYTKVIEYETVDKPNMELFILLWMEYDANKAIDVMALPIIDDVKRLIRQHVIHSN